MKENVLMQAAVLEKMEFNLSDFALFLSVMKNKKAHRNILSVILGEQDLQLKDVNVEEVILNKSGKRAIRLDARAVDMKNRYFATEMQNDTGNDDMRKRARYYQGLLDTPILKSGKRTRYKELPPTIVTFITQDDIFGKDLAKYTFTEQCEEVKDLRLEDGTKKIFLNMTSKNGEPVLVSLLQYMKNTTLNNPDIVVKDKRITELDQIVTEVKQSEEWEAVKVSLLSVGIGIGKEEGRRQGLTEGLTNSILTILQSKGTLTEQMISKVKKEEDQAVLNNWLLKASQAPDPETFWKEIE